MRIYVLRRSRFETGDDETRLNVSRPFLCCWRHLANTIEWSDNFRSKSVIYDLLVDCGNKLAGGWSFFKCRLTDLLQEQSRQKTVPMPHSHELNQTLVVWRPTGIATWRTLLNITSCLILLIGHIVWRHVCMYVCMYI